MAADRSLAVLLICRDPGRRAQLASLLETAHFNLAQTDSRGQLLMPEHVGLVISDTPLEADLEPVAAELRRQSIDLIAIGGQERADVALPADVSERELLNVVRLVYDRVRLRRLVQTLVRQQQSLVEQALQDVLTELPNRRAWEEQFVGRVDDLQAAGRDGCLAILDLDHFKQVNDQRGHAVGDQVLQAVGQTLRSRVRRADFVARLGGDEFGLLVEGLTPDSAPGVLERIRRDIVPPESAASLPPITASLGYVLFASNSSATPSELLNAADRALAQAKSAGRDRTLGSES